MLRAITFGITSESLVYLFFVLAITLLAIIKAVNSYSPFSFSLCGVAQRNVPDVFMAVWITPCASVKAINRHIARTTPLVGDLSTLSIDSNDTAAVHQRVFKRIRVATNETVDTSKRQVKRFKPDQLAPSISTNQAA